MQAKYVGRNGEYHAGIPARDLSPEDWAALDAEQRKLVRASALYEVTQEPDKSDPVRKKEA